MAKEKAKEQKRGRSEGKIVTPIVRVSFPHLYKKNDDGQYPSHKYEVVGLVEKTRLEELKPMKQFLLATARQVWPEIKYKDLETPFKDGDEKEDLTGYAGCVFFKAKSERKPGLVGPDALPLDDEKKVYGGCYARFSLTAFTYENEREEIHVDAKGNKKKITAPVKGVSFGLSHVQFVKDGESFGSDGGDPSKDFDAVEDLETGDVNEDEEFDEPSKKNGTSGKAAKAAKPTDDDEDSIPF